MSIFPAQDGSENTWGTELRNFFSPFFDLATGLFRTNVVPGAAIKSGEITDTQLATPTAGKVVTNGDAHNHAGGDGGQIAHTDLSSIGTNTHAQIDTFVASKAAASGLASLDGSSLVVQDPANAVWVTPTFNAGAFTASTGTWTVASGDRTTFEYVILGKLMLFNFVIAGTPAISGTPAELWVTIPAGKTIAKSTYGWIRTVNNGAYNSSTWYSVAGETKIRLLATIVGATWGTSGAVVGTAQFEIQ